MQTVFAIDAQISVLSAVEVGGGLARWRKRQFIGLAHDAANPAARFGRPEERTVVMGAHLEF